MTPPAPAVPTDEERESKQARAFRLLTLASFWTAVGVTALLALAAFRWLGPDSLALPLFNSDSAVPVLMSNEPRWDFFYVFFLGEDRFGAWPFLVAQALGSLFGRPVTPEFLHGWATLFLFAGAIPAALLFRPLSGLAVLAYAISVLLPESRGSLFELAQVYPWQLPLLLWAWWCLRCSWAASRPRARAGWLAGAALLCFVATWTAALSGPLLLAMTVLEGFNRQATPAPHSRRRWLLQLTPAVFAMAAEAALRAGYHRYVRARFGRDFHTALRLDWGHFLDNLRSVWAGLERPSILAALMVLLLYTARLLVGSQKASGRPWRLEALQCTVLGAFLLALLPLPILVLVLHVRLNDFAARYFAPTYVFLVFAGLLAVANWATSRSGGPRTAALWTSTLVLASVALLLLPRVPANANYARQRAAARALAERAPGELLLDGYWGTYVFAALAPAGELLPLPRSGEWNRLPALESKLPGAPRVVVGHRELLLGPKGTEPQWLFQYGTLLERDEPAFYSDGMDAFSTYRPRAVEAVPFLVEPALSGLELEVRGAELTLSAAAARPGTALAVEHSCLRLAPAPSGWGETAQGARVPLHVETTPGAVFFVPEEPARALSRLHLSFAKEVCQLRGARWYVQPSS